MTNLLPCLAYVAKLQPAVSGSGGHNATLRVACECIRFGLSDAESMRVLNEYNQRCKPKWTVTELAHKLTSARRLAATEEGTRGIRSGRRGSQNARKQTFDHTALELALAARAGARPTIRLTVPDAMADAKQVIEQLPAYNHGAPIVRQTVEVEEAYWREVWGRLGLPDPADSTGGLPHALP